jgi:hypothetical protein
MPAKWKIFFILNLLLALYSLVLLIATIATLDKLEQTTENSMFSILFIFCFTVMMVNSFLNIFLLQRFYPARPVPVGLRILSGILLVITILITIGFLIACLSASVYAFKDGDERHLDRTSRILFIVMLFCIVFQVITLIMQGQLPGRIRRNHQNSMHSLIDSIGQPQPTVEN